MLSKILPKDYFQQLEINTDENNYILIVYYALYPYSNYLWEFIIYYKTKYNFYVK